MTRLEFRVEPHAYALTLDGEVLARMEGGHLALLGGRVGRVREAELEAAIERSEDWLMPTSRSWQGLELRVQDDRGQLRGRLGATAALTPEEVELVFSRAVDDVAFGRPVEPELLADLVLLRELVHHGAVPRVVLD